WNEEPSSSFPAYQDVRRELQARPKGRQFFRPDAKGRGKGKGKGGRVPSKGKGGRGKSQQRSRTTFVVSQGPSKGAINRAYMMTGPNKTVAIYAGVRTAAGEGLVDSAAEDAVIGSGAFQRLRNVLAQQGLQPQPVRGPCGSCAGIGGSARVANIWDVPVGIAKNNGLLRITELEDCDGFETPFLIPVSFQELVGMVIDYDRAEVRTRQGNSTPMHRLPSGHRSVSVVEFDGKWSLPKELMTQGRDPFQLPRPLKAQTRTAPLGQQRDVAVWLRYSDGSFEQEAWLEGPRKSLVVPSECLPLETANQLDSSRVTYLDAAPDVAPYIINDVWCHSLGKPEPQRYFLLYYLVYSDHYGYHSFFAPGIFTGEWRADVGGPFLREPRNMQQCIRSLVHGEGEGVQPKAAARRRGATWCERSWARIVMILVRMIATVRQQLVVDSLILDAYAPSASASSSTTAPPPKEKQGKKKDTKVRQGLGTQLSRSQAQNKWTLEPESCPHEEQDLRMRGNQARHWWACLKCGSRWERVETDTVENPVPTNEDYTDRVDFPREPLDYTNREADAEDEDRGRLQGHAQEGHPGVLRMYQFEPTVRSEGSMSVSDPSMALAISEGQTRTLDRINLQALRGHHNNPQEWADYEQTQGPMETPHRRSRSLPAGVHPVQDLSRRRQVQLTPRGPEVFAIHENHSDEDKDKDVTPGSFSMVSPNHEAGVVQGGGGLESYNFVLFQMPDETFEFKAVSRPIVEQPPSEVSLSDGNFRQHGPFGTRVLSFLCAWSFYHGVETERILGAVENYRPALIVGRIESNSRKVLVQAGVLQDNRGGMFALMCDRRAVPGLCRQLPSASPVLFSDSKHVVAVLVNDNRAFTNLKWDQQNWADTDDLESLEVSVVAFLELLCHPNSLTAFTHANMEIIGKLVAQMRNAFEGLLTASRTFLAAEELGQWCLFPRVRQPRTEDEAQGGSLDHDEVEADEALEEVRQSLRPVTESTKVAEALKNVDDFRRHEEFGKFSLHPQLRREIFKVHRNLNHPSKEVFLRALKHAGTKDEIIAWVKEHFSCPLCESARRPMAARPAHLARCLTFNSVIAIDLFYLSLFGTEKIFLVCVDHGTGFVQVARCRDAKAERTVQTLKNKILLTIKDITAHEEELDVVIAHVVSAYNSMYDRHGFTPDQRVFGRSVRMPASLLADDRLNQELLMESAGDAVQRSWDIRSAARQAWLKKDDAEAVRRARRVQTRATDMHSYTLQPGQWVYVWRRSDHRHGWTGPGALIAQVPGGTSWWINVRGRLWKASAEQIRPAADEEDLGASLMIELHRDLTKQLKEGRQVTFQDVTDEGGPQDFVEEEDLSELFDLDRRSDPRVDHAEAAEPVEPGTPSLGDTTTAGEEQSLPLDSSAPQESRRQSVSSAPVIAEEEMPEGPEPRDSGAQDSRRTIRVDEGSSGTMSFGPIPPPHGQRSQPYLGQTNQVGPSNYLDVMDFDAAADAISSTYWVSGGPHWVRQTTSGRSFLKPLSPKTYFQASAAEASYCAKDRCMYVGKAKSSFGQVEFAKLQNAEKTLFRKAREKELQSLLENKAVKILSLKESAEFRRLHPEAILESRFVDRYKPAGIKPEELQQARQDAIEKGELQPLELSEDDTSPKSRWCVVGWKDPQIHQIERSAPTPSSASINVVLQLIASRRWCGYLRDVKTAFLQSRPTDRRVPIACMQPRDECMPGLHPDQLILLLTEVYGLVSGPSWWRSSLLQRLYKHNYHLCPYESCVLVLPGEKPGDPTEGVSVVEVDDLVEAGSQKHRDKLAALEKEIRFGKITNLLEASEQESTYAGRTLRQLQDYSFVTHMEEYVYTRLAPITLAKKTLKKDAAATPLDPGEITQLRGVIAALSWMSRECRPDAAAAASILASCFPEPTAEHAMQANEVIRQLKQFPLRLRIHSIEETKVRNIVISDSAFDTTGKEKSQHGYLVGFTNDEMNVGRSAPVSLTRWCSRRLRRKASSSMLCEAIAFSAATAALEKQDALWDALRISFYDPRQRQRTEAEALELQGKSSVIATEAPLYRDPRILAVIDAKALFDSLLSDQPSDCERTNLEIAVIRESLQVCRARTRWVPHNVNPADALTKFQGCHLEPLVKMLKSGRYQISDEDEVLKSGRQGLQRKKQGIGSLGNSSFLGAVKQYLLSWI
ncbi:GIP, partial [Symbiodinium necroappetens]